VVIQAHELAKQQVVPPEGQNVTHEEHHFRLDVVARRDGQLHEKQDDLKQVLRVQTEFQLSVEVVLERDAGYFVVGFLLLVFVSLECQVLEYQSEQEGVEENVDDLGRIQLELEVGVGVELTGLVEPGQDSQVVADELVLVALHA